MPSQNRPILARTPVLLICALVCCALWGSAIPAIKLSYQLFAIDTGNTGSLLLFAGIRFALAGVLVLVAGSVMERRPLLPARNDWGRICCVSLFQTVLQYLLYYIALARTTGVTASILVGTNTFFSILIAALVFRMERLTRNKILGCIAGFAGVVLVQLGGGGRITFSLGGEGLMLLSALSAAVSAALIARFSSRISLVTLSGWQFTLGGIVLALAGLGLGGDIGTLSAAPAAMLVYLALVSAVAYTLWGCLLKHNPVSRVTVCGFLTPLFGVLFSALALKESALGARSLCALALVCLGILLVNLPSETAPDPDHSPPREN